MIMITNQASIQTELFETIFFIPIRYKADQRIKTDNIYWESQIYVQHLFRSFKRLNCNWFSFSFSCFRFSGNSIFFKLNYPFIVVDMINVMKIKGRIRKKNSF